VVPYARRRRVRRGETMQNVAIFWDPQGIELDTLGKKKYLRVSDGDSPYVSMSIRMLSIDTPEVHYPVNTPPSRHDADLAQLADWIQDGEAGVERGLGEHLRPKLATGSAGSLQEDQGMEAARYFKQLLAEKLTRPNRSKRDLFLRVADQPFDQYGRLLAYMAPHYTAKERETMTRAERATFNLMMVASGWAALFPVYPSLPRHVDLAMIREAAEEAYRVKRGAWADPMTLTGYEFRMCVRLYEITAKALGGKRLSSSEKGAWISRYCADMTTGEIFYPQEYHRVPPYNRVFIWPSDVPKAVAAMNLVPPRER
jgi:endonuclease YncB( thermonuclease family)